MGRLLELPSARYFWQGTYRQFPPRRRSTYKELEGPYTPTPAAYVPIPKHKIVIQVLLPGAYSK
jgi:hypothetical protein